MRILDLGLDRYGPFTGRRLSFRPDARLHVVFGRNEAGKSCSLAAVTDLMFGIERQTRYDFVHQGKEMQLAATVSDRAGRTLSFRRRKLRPVLSGQDDGALPDDALAPFLGGLTRDVFRRAFGLDAEALRRSGDDLERSDGELGGALLAAASGLRGFGELQKTLEKEAGEIFAARASKDRRFYQALTRYETARSLLREKETRAGALKALREEIERHDSKLAEVRRRRAELAVDQGRLQRLKRAAPVIRSIDALVEQLEGLDLPAAPEGFGALLAAALQESEEARRRRDDAREGAEAEAAAREALAVDEALLARAEDIAQLRDLAAASRKGLQDLPRVQADADRLTAALADIAARLGLPDGDAVIASRPTDAAMARLSAVLAEGRPAVQKAEAARAATQKARDELQRRCAERERRGALRDPKPLRDRLAALGPVLRRAEQRQQSAAAVAAERRDLAEGAGRLSPPIADLDALAVAPLPARETVAAFQRRLAGCDEVVRQEHRVLDAAREEAARCEIQLADLAAGGPVPTPDRIAETRRQRDAVWQGLRAALFGQPGSPSGPDLAALVSDFEATLVRADALADAATTDAARVQSHAAASRSLGRHTEAARAAAERLATAEGQREAAFAEWNAAWAAAGIAPGSPAEMAEWLARAEALLQRRSALGERLAQAETVDTETEGLRALLEAITAELSLAPMPGAAVDVLAARLATEIERVAEGWDSARDLDTRIAESQRLVAEAEQAQSRADAALDAWSRDLAAALPALGLPATAGPAEAQAALEAWRDVPGLVRERDDRLRRAAGIKRDAKQLEKRLAILVDELGNDLPEGSADAVVRRLDQRLLASREASTRRDEAEKRLESARRVLADAERRLSGAENRLVELARVLDRQAEDPALGDIAQGLVRRDDLLSRLALKRDELTNAADGREEAGLREELASHDLDGTEGELARMASEAEELDQQSRETYAARTQALQKLTDLEGSTDAEFALQQRRGAEAEMLEAARDWAVLSVGALMIGTAIERQRSARQGPLLARAGQLFGTLTGGRYEGLAQAYDEDDVPRLVGRRAGGPEVAVSAMSEGTRDQLYLALRLAYLEDYAARAEPAPFVGDDLFSSFDDERTAHGLAALAAIGGTVQPILFTHHRFVADSALRHLGEAADVIEL